MLRQPDLPATDSDLGLVRRRNQSPAAAFNFLPLECEVDIYEERNMRNFGLIVGAGLLLAACASEPDRLLVSEINVQTDLSAVQSPQAVARWQALDSDLQTALAAELAGNISPAGQVLAVDIDELSLSESYAPGVTIEDARLTGTATLLSPGDGFPDTSYNITVTSSDVVSYLPPGTDVVTISPTSQDYYEAVVRAFARGTANAFRTGGA